VSEQLTAAHLAQLCSQALAASGDLATVLLPPRQAGRRRAAGDRHPRPGQPPARSGSCPQGLPARRRRGRRQRPPAPLRPARRRARPSDRRRRAGQHRPAGRPQLAWERGRALGERVRAQRRLGRLGPERALTVASELLAACGYEPVRAHPAPAGVAQLPLPAAGPPCPRAGLQPQPRLRYRPAGWAARPRGRRRPPTRPSSRAGTLLCAAAGADPLTHQHRPRQNSTDRAD
jgi:hypothetical protein